LFADFSRGRLFKWRKPVVPFTGAAVPHTRTQFAEALYGGQDPRDLPAYLIGEAAHYLRLPGATVRSWVVGRRYPAGDGSRFSKPLIDVADPDELLLSFRNLVELYVLSSIRRGHQVQLKAIRRAIDFLRKRFKCEHPLLDRQMLTDGKSLLVEHYGDLVNISEGGQLEMKELLGTYLKRIDRDPRGIPIRLFPFTRPAPAEGAPRLVSIDPTIRFGKPCIAGTRIPTSIIAERHEAGDSVALLAEDYGRSQEEIEEALRYERRAAS
jgi:uncharacterized protein (DUF433 family)